MLKYIFERLLLKSHIKFYYIRSPRSIIGWSFVSAGSETYHFNLISCAFSTFNLVAVTVAGKGRKRSGKIGFQIVFSTWSNRFMLHFKFVEAQKKQMSLRRRRYICFIFICVWMSTHARFLPPSFIKLQSQFWPIFFDSSTPCGSYTKTNVYWKFLYSGKESF